ncbi:RDD family protein [Ostreibacterium oceani]|uniref:RDD domain-containing protein n=1 Tax=Ostreibacterium oceani TaxID=2654998 RepID=A0A6N7EVE3_9GAMM|nr:RDD family protein [Ostreibacterium oceani]MPV86521.1 hypothetical protein [Ostreibacterium oceani]
MNQPPNQPINQPPNQPVKYASFIQRFAAFVIDNILLLVVFTPLIPLLTGPEFEIAQQALESALTTLEQATTPEAINQANAQFWQASVDFFKAQNAPLIQFITLLITLFFWVRFAGTPGKRLLGLKVVNADTLAPLNILPATLRYLGYFVSFFFFGMGFLWILIDPKKQGWHDKMGRSVVIVESKQTTFNRKPTQSPESKTTSGAATNPTNHDDIFKA